MPLPSEDLRVILAPVRTVWERLERQGARKLVEAATRTELRLVEGFAGRVDAAQVLADRLARRLDEQMRLGAPITNPVGWLVSRALSQRQQCGDRLCDDRMLLDSGRDCPRCEDRQASSRAQRNAVAAAVEGAMPFASPEERRTAAESQLHEVVTVQAWAREHRWEQERARKAAAAKARTEAAAARPALDEPAAPQAPVVLPAPRSAPAVPKPEDGVVDQELALEELSREQVVDWRNRAATDHRWCSTTSTGTARCRRGACSRARSSTRSPACPAWGTSPSAKPPGSGHERAGTVGRRPGPGRAAGRDGDGARERQPYDEGEADVVGDPARRKGADGTGRRRRHARWPGNFRPRARPWGSGGRPSPPTSPGTSRRSAHRVHEIGGLGDETAPGAGPRKIEDIES